MQELKPVDLVVIGGGINGAGIARDAAVEVASEVRNVLDMWLGP